eukprot:m.128191 g.128191  ORF g.128191 m.128191 type:complete len:372 (+) comp29322_c1_seq1:204-1319(+)
MSTTTPCSHYFSFPFVGGYKVNGRAQKVTASHNDKRRRNRSVEVQRSHIILSNDPSNSWNQRRARSNIDPADVIAASEIRRFQKAHKFTESRSLSTSRCSSWVSLSSSPGSSLSGSTNNLSGFESSVDSNLGNDDDSGINMTMFEPRSLEIPPFDNQQHPGRKLPRTPSATQRSNAANEPLPSYFPPPYNGGGKEHGGSDQPHSPLPNSPLTRRSDPELKTRPDSWHSAGDLVRQETLRPHSYHSTDIHNVPHNTDPLNVDTPLDECVPLREEETSFEGVTLAQLKQLEDLQLQRQMLLLEETRLANAFSPAPPPMYGETAQLPPSYLGVLPTHQQHHRHHNLGTNLVASRNTTSPATSSCQQDRYLVGRK